MVIRYHRTFEKHFKKLSPWLKQKTIAAIKKFTRNPFDPTLRNHALTGRLREQRAFSVTGNVRVIFEEHEHYTLVLMLDVGTHPQIYGD